MGLLIANDNLLTALGITNKEQFDQTFADFSEFETFVEKCGYEYDFDEEGNLILITPKSKEINTGIVVKKDYSKEYFTLEAIEDCIFTFKNNTFNDKTIQYSTDKGKIWNILDLKKYNTINTPKFQSGSKILLKGNEMSGGYNINSTGKFNVSGNILSIIIGEEFINNPEMPENGSGVSNLFKDCDKIISCKNLIVSYRGKPRLINGLFENCINLIDTCQLNLDVSQFFGGYKNVYRGCTSLKNIEIELSNKVPMSSMFENCTGLQNVKIIANINSYPSEQWQYMFKGCTSLEKVEILNPNNMKPTGGGSNAFKECFANCTKLQNIETSLYKYGGMFFTDWVLNVAPTGIFKFTTDSFEVNQQFYYGTNFIPEGWTVLDKDGNEMVIS